MGKTTFIYHLVGMLLEIGYLPLVCTCQEFEVVKPNTAIQLLIYLAEMHNQYSDRKFNQETIFNIFDSHHKKIIFLFDGLDQIKSNDYPYIAGAIEKNCYGYHYLITSRPSAVNHLESRKEYVFLRLQMFSQKAVSAFLGNHYKSARDLTSFAPDLIRTPMLAYMVKELLEEEPERDIQTRTELYQAFVSYIVREHNKEEYQFTKAMNIKKNLQKISYTALVLENPQIQKISLEHCYAQLENMTCEDLTTYGFVYLALEKSDFLYFTHQSFQEYFAACYVKEHPKYIDKVIIQMWHPKWKEVIKFLAGLLGIDFVMKIYAGKDNVIHSRLFLAIDCVVEIREKEGEYIEKLLEDLNKILFEEPFREVVLKAHLALNKIDYVLRLLCNQDSDVRISTAKFLQYIDGNLPVEIINQLIKLLRNPNSYVCTSAANTLGKIGGNLPAEIISQLGMLLCDQDYSVRLKEV